MQAPTPGQPGDPSKMPLNCYPDDQLHHANADQLDGADHSILLWAQRVAKEQMQKQTGLPRMQARWETFMRLVDAKIQERTSKELTSPLQNQPRNRTLHV